MDWGLLQGLGQGMQQAGQMWDAKQKQKLAEQLELAREERAEQRQLAREERQAARAENTVASWVPVMGEDGVLWYQGVNSAGTPKGERRLANQSEIEEFQRQRQKDQLSLDGLVADTQTKQFKAGRLETEAAQSDELFGLRRRSLEADIGAAQALASQRRSKASGKSDTADTEVPLSDLAEAMVKEYSTMFGDYDMPHAQKLEVARAAITTARREGKDPVDVARRALPAFDKWRQGRSKPSRTTLD